MCLNIFIVALAAVSVSSKPQFGFIQHQRQQQFVPVPEETVYSESFVRNRAININSRHNAVPSNQFLNPEVRETQTDVDRSETTQKLEVHTQMNADELSDNRYEGDNRNRAVTRKMNTQFHNRKLNEEKNSGFVNANHSVPSTKKGIVKSFQTSRRRHPPNIRHKESVSVNSMPNLTPNNSNYNQNVYRNTVNSSSIISTPNTQFPKNDNTNYNRAPDIEKDNTIPNPHSNNSNHTYRPDYRSNVDINDQNERTVSNIEKVSNGSPSDSSFQAERTAFTNVKHDVDAAEENEEGDRWIWGYTNVTERGVTGTTPDLDDRASFDGGSCATGKVKIGTKCVDKD